MEQGVDAFLAQVNPPDISKAELSSRLRAVIASAKETWAQFPEDGLRFSSYLGARVAEEEDPIGALEKRHRDDLYLAFHVLQGQADAVKAFERMCDDAVGTAARRFDTSSAFIDDVKQAVRMKLLINEAGGVGKLGNYRGTGKLRSWVQVVAVRVALEFLRRRKPTEHASDDALVGMAAMGDDPELAHIKQLYLKEFKQAFHRALDMLSSRERNMLRMVLVDGLSLTELAAFYRVHRTTASRQLAAAREKLVDATRERLSEVLELSSEQFYSLLQNIRSHLDLSLESVL